MADTVASTLAPNRQTVIKNDTYFMGKLLNSLGRESGASGVYSDSAGLNDCCEALMASLTVRTPVG